MALFLNRRLLRALVKKLARSLPLPTCTWTRLEFGKALEAIWELVQSTNQYIDKTAPWKLAKEPDAREHLDEVLLHLAAVLKTLGVVLYPFMPSKGEEIFRQIGLHGTPLSFFLQLQPIGLTCQVGRSLKEIPFSRESNRTHKEPKP